MSGKSSTHFRARETWCSMLLVWPAIAQMGQHRGPMGGGVFSHIYFYQSELLCIRVYSQL